MQACSYKASDMSHINQEHSAIFVSNVSNALKVNDARICTSASYNQLRLALLNLSLQCFIIQHFGFGVDTVVYHVIVGAGDVNRGAVGQVTTLG